MKMIAIYKRADQRSSARLTAEMLSSLGGSIEPLMRSLHDTDNADQAKVSTASRLLIPATSSLTCIVPARLSLEVATGRPRRSSDALFLKPASARVHGKGNANDPDGHCACALSACSPDLLNVALVAGLYFMRQGP